MPGSGALGASMREGPATHALVPDAEGGALAVSPRRFSLIGERLWGTTAAFSLIWE